MNNLEFINIHLGIINMYNDYLMDMEKNLNLKYEFKRLYSLDYNDYCTVTMYNYLQLNRILENTSINTTERFKLIATMKIFIKDELKSFIQEGIENYFNRCNISIDHYKLFGIPLIMNGTKISGMTEDDVFQMYTQTINDNFRLSKYIKRYTDFIITLRLNQYVL